MSLATGFSSERSSRAISGEAAARRLDSRRRRTRRPLLERLEDRVVLTVNVTSSFSALDFNASGGYTPPDTSGAVGPVKFVESVNQTVGVYDRATGAVTAVAGLDTFYFSTGGLARADAGSGLSDPIVTYDSQIGRFIVGDQDVNFSTHVSTFDIAVSKTSTPGSLTKADWNFYRIVMTENGFDADYPGNFGYNHDAFVYTLNMFGVSGGGHTQVVSVSNADLLAGAATPAVFRNDLNDFSVRPSVMHDSVAGDPMWLVSEHGDNQSIDVIKMANPLSAAPTFAYTTLNVAPYSGAVPPRNPNGTVITDKTDSRILNAAESNNTLVASHVVSLSSTQDVAQWYSVNVGGATPTLNQQGRVTYGPKTYVYYPSIDINPAGTIGMTFMKSGNDTANDFMSVYNTGRLPSDPAGTMETAAIVPAGVGVRNYSDFTSSGSAGGRAGDLSGISVDPSNGTFWSVNEFANTEPGANWGTAVSNFRIINPLPAADLAVTVTGPSSVDVSSGPVTATYRITVTNNGPVAAQNVVLSDALPNGSIYVSMIETTGSDPYTITQSGGIATATATADIAAGATDVFTLVVTAPTSLVNGASFSDTANVTADNPDPVPANNTSTATGVVVNSKTPAGIVTLLSGPAAGNEGDFVSYNITVSNTGPGAASNVLISDTLNPQLTFKSASVSTGAFSIANGVITFNIGVLTVGSTFTATINAQNAEAGALSNNVVVTTTNPVGNPTFASASVVTFFSEGDIVVSSQQNTTSKSVTNYLAAAFTHANAIESASSFVASINWGDGKTTVGVVALSGTSYIVTGSHVYATAGKHTITTKVVEVGANAITPEANVNDAKNTNDSPAHQALRDRDIVRHARPRKLPKVHVAANHPKARAASHAKH